MIDNTISRRQEGSKSVNLSKYVLKFSLQSFLFSLWLPNSCSFSSFFSCRVGWNRCPSFEEPHFRAAELEATLEIGNSLGNTLLCIRWGLCRIKLKYMHHFQHISLYTTKDVRYKPTKYISRTIAPDESLTPVRYAIFLHRFPPFQFSRIDDNRTTYGSQV